MLSRKDALNKRSVNEMVKNIGYLSVPSGNRSDMKLFRMIYRISTFSSSVASQTALNMPAETGILKKDSLLLLHLAGVTTRFMQT